MSQRSFRKVKHVAAQVLTKVPYEAVDLRYVGLEHIRSWTGEITIDDNASPEGIVSLFQPHDILFGKLRPYLAKVALPNFAGACSTEALVLRPGRSFEPRFLRYALSDKNFIDEVNTSTYGAKMPRASWEFIGSRLILMPDLETQKAIANFLDGETARIDELIKKRQAFLDLIAEKKAALTEQAVNGNILGVPTDGKRGWFGRLPADWFVRRAKFLFRERLARSESGDEELLTVSHITGVTKRSEKDVNMFLAESMEGYKLVYKGDVVINTMWAWMGAMGVSPVEGLQSILCSLLSNQ
jgi:type I restriction enzyme, S subunit